MSQTERHLKDRAGEHISISALTGKWDNIPSKRIPLKFTAPYQVASVSFSVPLTLLYYTLDDLYLCNRYF